MATTKVVTRVDLPFGGTRFLNGQSNVILWSDGVVIATAWSPTVLDGELITFRGTVIKRDLWTHAQSRWVLREEADGSYLGDFATRKEAVACALRWAQRYAFRALNTSHEVIG